LDSNDLNLQSVWGQDSRPVVLRGGPVRPLLVRLPSGRGRGWLRRRHRGRLEWVADLNAWDIPKSWFEDVLKRCLRTYGAVYVIQPYNSLKRCVPPCWNALGAHCECSCMGANHGSGHPEGRWHIVSETIAIRIGADQFSCRLLLPP